MAKLFIIGNGFDLAHKLPTSYANFYEYMRKIAGDELIESYSKNWLIPQENDEEYEKKLAALLVNIIDRTGKASPNDNLKSKWSNFENALGYLDLGKLYEVEKKNTVGENCTGNTDDHMQLYCANKVGDAVLKINDFFDRWVESIDLSKDKYGEEVKRHPIKNKFENNTLFLNFNYTETLENVYGIPKERICYIHGNRQSDASKLIIGYRTKNELLHDKTHENDVFTNKYPKKKFTEDEIADEKLNVINGSLYKNAESISSSCQNLCFFNKLSTVTEIYDYGWSVIDNYADRYYLKLITEFSNIDKFWLNYHDKNDEEIETAKKIISEHGFRGDIDIYEDK